MNIKVNLAALAGQIPSHVTMVAVSKTQPAEALEAALDAGLRVFGENRVQEAIAHWRDVRPHYPDLRLHLIGPLQTNKVRDAVALFDVIETVDRPKLIDALAREMARQGRALPCLIQVNIGDEEQKAGVASAGVKPLLKQCRDAGLNIRGLMCIPPVDEPPAPHFQRLAGMAQEMGLDVLSMGMSGDFAEAIAAGATHVRIGSLLFGARSGT